MGLWVTQYRSTWCLRTTTWTINQSCLHDGAPIKSLNTRVSLVCNTSCKLLDISARTVIHPGFMGRRPWKFRVWYCPGLHSMCLPLLILLWILSPIINCKHHYDSFQWAAWILLAHYWNVKVVLGAFKPAAASWNENSLVAIVSSKRHCCPKSFYCPSLSFPGARSALELKFTSSLGSHSGISPPESLLCSIPSWRLFLRGPEWT